MKNWVAEGIASDVNDFTVDSGGARDARGGSEKRIEREIDNLLLGASLNLQSYLRRCTMTRFLGVYRYKNGFGGGIWFGKRKKRSVGDMNSNLIINAISEFETKYEDDED